MVLSVITNRVNMKLDMLKKFAALFIVSAILVSCGASGKNDEKVELSPIMKKALEEKTSRFYANFEEFPQDKKMLPIGVFDSGTGGLTVLEVMLSIDKMDNITGKMGSDGIPDFAGENFSFLGDMANMPYGNYAAEKKEQFFKELVVKDALFLLGDKYYKSPMDETPAGVKEKSKILVIACNTATAWGLNDIQVMLDRSGTGVRVIGVINAGVNALYDNIKKDSLQLPTTVGVLATKGTISSNAYERTIREMYPEKGYAGEINVVNHACAGFAESVDMEKDFVNVALTAPRADYRGPKMGLGSEDIKEELLPAYNFTYGKNDILYKKENGKFTEFQLNSAANYARFHLVTLLEKHIASGNKAPMKNIILGCTHYPFLLDTLVKAVEELRAYSVNGKRVYNEVLAEDLAFIDPAVFTAIECYQALREDKNLALRTTDGKVDAYISVPAYGLAPDCLDENGNLSYNFKYGREYGTEDITTVFVPISRRYVSKENLSRLEALVPYSYNEINKIME